jgi:HPt (histidine-containing phosphotransfer) domain-containing protein
MTLSIIVPSALEQYRDTLGDEFVIDLVHTFLDDSTRLAKEMEHMITIQDIDGFCRAAHSLKSTCATMGAIELSKKYEDLEYRGREEKLNDLEHLVTIVDENLLHVHQNLKDLLASEYGVTK